MADRRYTIGRPMQDVRLRNWEPGRVAQMKRAITILEDQLNQTMTANMNNGQQRTVQKGVPKVTNLDVRAGFKNFQISFDRARGINDLLFYEIQHDTAAGFPAPTTLEYNQTSLTIASTTANQTRYFRVRVVNSKFKCGLWSDTISATSSGNFRIEVNRWTASTETIAVADVETWITMATQSFSPSRASMFLNVHAGVQAQLLEVPGPDAFSFECISVDWRILANGVEMPNNKMRTVSTAYLASSGEANNVRGSTVAIGTMLTQFQTFTGNEDAITFELQAFIGNPIGLFDISFGLYETLMHLPALIFIDMFDVVTVVQGF